MHLGIPNSRKTSSCILNTFLLFRINISYKQILANFASYKKYLNCCYFGKFLKWRKKDKNASLRFFMQTLKEKNVVLLYFFSVLLISFILRVIRLIVYVFKWEIIQENFRKITSLVK